MKFIWTDNKFEIILQCLIVCSSYYINFNDFVQLFKRKYYQKAIMFPKNSYINELWPASQQWSVTTNFLYEFFITSLIRYVTRHNWQNKLKCRNNTNYGNYRWKSTPPRFQWAWNLLPRSTLWTIFLIHVTAIVFTIKHLIFKSLPFARETMAPYIMNIPHILSNVLLSVAETLSWCVVIIRLHGKGMYTYLLTLITSMYVACRQIKHNATFPIST